MCKSARRSLTNEEQGEDCGQLVDTMSQDVLHHGAGNERLHATVRVSEQQCLSWWLSGKSQRSEGVHDEVDPQHLHGFQRRVLETHTQIYSQCRSAE